VNKAVRVNSAAAYYFGPPCTQHNAEDI